MLKVFATATIVSLIMVFCTYIERPTHAYAQDLYQTVYPLNYGLEQNLHIPNHIAALLTILPNYACALGFMYASKHLTHAMSLSGLLPEYFRVVVGLNKIPIRALLTCTSIQFVLVIIVWSSQNKQGTNILFQLVVTSISCVFIGLFAAFLAFRKKFENLDRAFVSPFGEIGAYLGMIFALILLASALFMQPTSSWVG
jgi:amino acid transporter